MKARPLTFDTAPDVLTVPQVAELLNIGTKQAYAAIAEDQLPGAVRIGRSIRVGKAALLRMLDPNGPANDDDPAGKGEVVVALHGRADHRRTHE